MNVDQILSSNPDLHAAVMNMADKLQKEFHDYSFAMKGDKPYLTYTDLLTSWLIIKLAELHVLIEKK